MWFVIVQCANHLHLGWQIQLYDDIDEPTGTPEPDPTEPDPTEPDPTEPAGSGSEPTGTGPTRPQPTGTGPDSEDSGSLVRKRTISTALNALRQSLWLVPSYHATH